MRSAAWARSVFSFAILGPRCLRFSKLGAGAFGGRRQAAKIPKRAGLRGVGFEADQTVWASVPDPPWPIVFLRLLGFAGFPPGRLCFAPGARLLALFPIALAQVPFPIASGCVKRFASAFRISGHCVARILGAAIQNWAPKARLGGPVSCASALSCRLSGSGLRRFSSSSPGRAFGGRSIAGARHSLPFFFPLPLRPALPQPRLKPRRFSPRRRTCVGGVGAPLSVRSLRRFEPAPDAGGARAERLLARPGSGPASKRKKKRESMREALMLLLPKLFAPVWKKQKKSFQAAFECSDCFSSSLRKTTAGEEFMPDFIAFLMSTLLSCIPPKKRMGLSRKKSLFFPPLGARRGAMKQKIRLGGAFRAIIFAAHENQALLAKFRQKWTIKACGLERRDRQAAAA